GFSHERFNPEKEQIFLAFDRGFLIRAFTNLIYNAVIHNPPETKIRVYIAEQAEAIDVIIEDDGQGIGEDEIEKLFTRYYRGTSTNERHQGSGLGMAIARQIIEAHGGDIEVTSRIGEGTRVRILFSRIEKEPPGR
ncbi:sensor histidine kinase, partial [Aneurinibacillus danicus]|uniref:sensor histidine kinase n=1 Tax=Aneurinibacillus danicus TaxID=267746 RepID=UPI0011BE2429